MEKEDLIKVIYNHSKSLKSSIEQVKKDIEYQKDLLELKEKHNKSTTDVNEKINELKIILGTLEDIQSDFNEDIENEDVDLEEIKNYCER